MLLQIKTKINKDNHIYKEIFQTLVQEKSDGTKELTNEINYDFLTFYFKNDTAKKGLKISIMV